MNKMMHSEKFTQKWVTQALSELQQSALSVPIVCMFLLYCTLHCQQHVLQFVCDDKQERQCGTCVLHLHLGYPTSLMTFHLKRKHVRQFIVAINLGLHVKCPKSLPSFNKMLCLSKMFMKILSIKFQGICLVGVALIHAGDMDL
jgi:hypothetical protein